MGFFQDLKEDLSQAVNELLPEEEAAALEQENIEDKDVDRTLKEVEEALSAAFGETENADTQQGEGASEQEEPSDGEEASDDKETSENEEVSQNEDTTDNEEASEKKEAADHAETLAHAETSETKEGADADEDAAQEKEAAESVQAEPVKEEKTAKPEEAAQDHNTTFQPVKDAAAAQLKGIANIVAKEEVPFANVQQAGLEDEYEERQLQSPEELLSAFGETQTEETELEKEVGRAMAEQKMNLEDTQVADETALITAGMSITGDIASKGSMDVLGRVTGNIEVLGKLNISGTIDGDSKAAEIFADAAHITGKIKADGTVKIGQNSVIIGDIAASSAVIAGAVKGDIDVMGPVILDASAIVMGNIKSKSVQINNGAVIEGMCSQCYAEVNPTSFFDELVSK